MTNITNPFPYFPEAGTGGFIYVGAANLDARTNPITVYRDEARTIPWSQPIRTVDGYPAFQGAKASIYAAPTSVSLTVLNSQSRVVTNGLSFSSALDAFIADLASSAVGEGDALIEQSNGETVRSNSPVYIWRQRPSLVGDAVAGTPTQNAARLQAQINALSAAGGGTLRMVEAAVEIDRALKIPYGVSIIGPGSGRCVITNNYAPYDSGQTAIFQTGNFQPSYAQVYYSLPYSSEAKAFNASLSGDTAVTLTTSGDAAGFAVGDMVYVFSAAFYTTSGGDKQPYYATLRKITAISGGVIYLDDCLYSETAGGYLVNLRTTTAPGPPALAGGPDVTLFAWGDGEISGLSVSTLGNWGGVTSAAYRASFNDIDVLASRRIWYNNLMVNVQYNNVRGAFFVKAGEMSMNSENVVVSNATASYNQGLFVQALSALTEVSGTGTISSNVFTANAPTPPGTWTVPTRLYTADGTYYGTIVSNGTGSGGAGTYNLTGGTNVGTPTTFLGVKTPAGGISTQENSLYITFRDIVLNMTGLPSGTVLSALNAQNVRFDNVKAFHGGASFTGAVLSFGNDIVTANRRDSTDNFANVSWSGPCGIHAQISGSGSARNRIAGTFSGTPITSAIRIADTTNKNFILPGSTFLAGECVFVSGVANQEVSDVYIDGGMDGFTNSLAYPTMLANTVSNVRTAKTSGRQAANKQILLAVSATTTDTAIVSSDIGTGTLQRGDQIEFDIRCNATGTNAPKRLNFKLVNVTDGTTTTMASAVIAAASPGIYKFTGRIDVTNTALLVPVNVTVQGAAAVTPGEAAFTATDLATKQVRFEITVSNDSPSDTNSITVAKISLSNPRQL